jgi:hypothetical protein
LVWDATIRGRRREIYLLVVLQVEGLLQLQQQVGWDQWKEQLKQQQQENREAKQQRGQMMQQQA